MTADALHTLWGKGVGLQTAEGLITANRELIEEIAGDKLLNGQLDDGVVVISRINIEGQPATGIADHGHLVGLQRRSDKPERERSIGRSPFYFEDAQI